MPGSLPNTRTASAALSSKRATFSARSAFPRQVHSVALFRERLTPATVPEVLPPPGRLPAPFRLPPLARERLDPEPEAIHQGGFGAERRLSISAIDSDPRARPPVRPNPAHHTRDRSRAQLLATAPHGDVRATGGLAPCREKPAEISQARDRTDDAAGTSLRDRSRGELYPDPIDSDTSCHRLVAKRVWRPAPLDAGSTSSSRACPATAAFAHGSLRAAVHAPPRRGAQLTAPEVPSAGGRLRRG